jgi:hypothetical protein
MGWYGLLDWARLLGWPGLPSGLCAASGWPVLVTAFGLCWSSDLARDGLGVYPFKSWAGIMGWPRRGLWGSLC